MARQGDPADLRLIVMFLRSVRRWTQEELSQASGVDRGLISDYELGNKAPTHRTLARLAAGAGLPHSFLETLLPTFRAARLAVEGRRTSADPAEHLPRMSEMDWIGRSSRRPCRASPPT